MRNTGSLSMSRPASKLSVGFLIWSAALAPTATLAADWTASIRQDPADKAISGLAVDSAMVPIEIDDRTQPPVIQATLKAVYTQNQAGWTLSSAQEELVTTDGKKTEHPFVVRTLLNGPETSIDLVAVNPSGSLEKQTLTLVVDQWDALLETAKNKAASRSRFSAGIGPEFMSLKDSRIADSSQTGLGLRVGWTRPFAPTPWTVKAELQLTLALISSSSTTFDYRMLKTFALAERHFSVLSAPWSLSAGAGYGYQTMLTSAVKGGYKNLSGPVLRLIGERTLSSEDSIEVTLGYSQVQFTFSNHEFLFGAAFKTTILDGRPLSAGLEFTTQSLTLQTVTFQNQIFALLGRIGI